jgi:hypothetical protein
VVDKSSTTSRLSEDIDSIFFYLVQEERPHIVVLAYYQVKVKSFFAERKAGFAEDILCETCFFCNFAANI